VTQAHATDKFDKQLRQSCESVEDSARVAFLPFTIRSVGSHYLIFRFDNGAMVRTSAVGAEAVKLLRKGNSIGAVKVALGRKYGCAAEAVNLTPLLHSLAVKELILKIGTVRFPVKLPPFWQRVWKSAKNAIAAKWISVAVRCLPLSFLLRLLYAPRHMRNERTLQCIEANLARAVRLPLSQQERSAVSGRNYELLRRSYIDRLLLAGLSPRKLGKWFREYFVMSGGNQLDDAIKAGKRVVLCGFHMGSYTLIPFVLAAWGYRVTALASAHKSEQATAERTVRHLRSAGLGSDLALVYGNFGMRSLVRAVEGGCTALILPDAFLGQAGKGRPVDFLGARFRPSAGLAWLCERSDTTVFPIYLQTQPDGRHLLTVDEEITAHRDGAEVTARVYRRLEEVVSNDPSQWLRWTDFHKMICGEVV